MAVDDVIAPENAKILIERVLSSKTVYKVLLRPRLNEVLKRNAERTHKAFDTNILDNIIKRIYREQDLEEGCNLTYFGL